MSKARFAVFGLILAGGIAVAVSGLLAQTARRPDERSRPRMMMLDGRGGQIGVVVEDLDAAGLKAAGSATGGVRLEQVDQDGPAAKAGLREGDVIVDVDGDRVRSARQFSRLIQETADGRAVKLGIVRDGQRQTAEVTPESRAFGFGFDSDRIGRDIARQWRDLEPQLREFRFNGPMDFHFDMPGLLSSPRARLGIGIDELTPQLAEYFGVKDGGVLVSSITHDSAAERAGLKAGDVIVSINGDRVRHADDLIDELRAAEGQDVTIGIVRDKKESTLKATIEESPRPLRRRPA